MNNRFFEQPILASPYEYPSRHWELDDTGQPTKKITEKRRRAEFITPIPKPRQRKGSAAQSQLLFGEGKGISTDDQHYDHTAIINGVRQQVDRWRNLPSPNQWQVTPETARLLQHRRHHRFSGIRPFFCQVKAVRPERDALEIRFPRVAGYRVELPQERLTAEFTDESVLILTPDLVGPSITRNAGIIGEDVELNLEHLQDLRRSTLLFNITQRLLYTKWRDPGAEPKLYLFGQLKRITKQWLDNYLVCKGETYPAQLMYQELADMACERITAGITRALVGERPIKVVLDPYNPVGSTAHVNFNTSKTSRYETDAWRCHINWVILDSDWEAEFCCVADAHPQVKAYVKNHNLGLEVPYRCGSEARTYVPDFIVLVDDGRGNDDPLHLIVEIKGYRKEDAKEKKTTMETYWVPGVNNLGHYGRWALVEFTDIYAMQDDFRQLVEVEFNKMLAPYLVRHDAVNRAGHA